MRPGHASNEPLRATQVSRQGLARMLRQGFVRPGNWRLGKLAVGPALRTEAAINLLNEQETKL